MKHPHPTPNTLRLVITAFLAQIAGFVHQLSNGDKHKLWQDLFFSQVMVISINSDMFVSSTMVININSDMFISSIMVININSDVFISSIMVISINSEKICSNAASG